MKIIMIILSCTILSLLVMLFLLSIVSKFSKNKWFCTFWGWHKDPKITGFDGCSLTARCLRCDEFMMKDSQGNWF